MARFAFVSANVWLLPHFQFTPALLLELWIRLLRESEAGVGALDPFILFLREIFPLSQVVETFDFFAGERVVFGTVVKCTRAIAGIGRMAVASIDAKLIIRGPSVYISVTSKLIIVIAIVNEPVLG